MAYTYQLVKLDYRYTILLLICVLLLVRPHLNWKNKDTFGTRNMVKVVSKQTIQVAKAPQLPNINQERVYRSNDMDTHVYTWCVGANWKLVSFYNEVYKVSSFLD